MDLKANLKTRDAGKQICKGCEAAAAEADDHVYGCFEALWILDFGACRKLEEPLWRLKPLPGPQKVVFMVADKIEPDSSIVQNQDKTSEIQMLPSCAGRHQTHPQD